MALSQFITGQDPSAGVPMCDKMNSEDAAGLFLELRAILGKIGDCSIFFFY